MQELSVNSPLALPQVYVDDTAQLTHGTSHNAITNMVNAVMDFVALTRHLKLTVSIKGGIVSKIPGAAKLLVKELAKEGSAYQVKASTRDLGEGCTFSAECRHKRAVTNQRMKNL